MDDKLVLRTPIDGSVYFECAYADEETIDMALAGATKAQLEWRETPLDERIEICEKFNGALLAKKAKLGLELTWQMGRPVRYAQKEIETCVDRSRTMIRLAKEALAPQELDEKEGFRRYLTREPLGVVLVVPAWNYPYMIAVNSVIPALLAGNAVVLKHSSQTALVAERFAEAFSAAGLPSGLFQVVHANHEKTARIIADERVQFVAFTGSVGGGHAVTQAAASRFVGLGLELGGKDPAYVRADADISFAVENLVDGSFFNSGQSCCGIERIYVHESVYDRFWPQFVELTHRYVLDDPRMEETTLGPVARASGAETVRQHIGEALEQGARAFIDPQRFPRHEETGQYLAPQVLLHVNHEMRIMREESFGPVVGIMKVSGDDEAIQLMNDSDYGLTASIWTEDIDTGTTLLNRVETGTAFLNRCDYLDPELAWVGVKNSGRGCTLSAFGFEQLTRPKSLHLRTRTSS